jgi:hypothetical protein
VLNTSTGTVDKIRPKWINYQHWAPLDDLVEFVYHTGTGTGGLYGTLVKWEKMVKRGLLYGQNASLIQI